MSSRTDRNNERAYNEVKKHADKINMNGGIMAVVFIPYPRKVYFHGNIAITNHVKHNWTSIENDPDILNSYKRNIVDPPTKPLAMMKIRETQALASKVLTATIGHRKGFNDPSKKPVWFPSEVDWNTKRIYKKNKTDPTVRMNLIDFRAIISAYYNFHGIELPTVVTQSPQPHCEDDIPHIIGDMTDIPVVSHGISPTGIPPTDIPVASHGISPTGIPPIAHRISPTDVSPVPHNISPTAVPPSSHGISPTGVSPTFHTIDRNALHATTHATHRITHWTPTGAILTTEENNSTPDWNYWHGHIYPHNQSIQYIHHSTETLQQAACSQIWPRYQETATPLNLSIPRNSRASSAMLANDNIPQAAFPSEKTHDKHIKAPNILPTLPRVINLMLEREKY